MLSYLLFSVQKVPSSPSGDSGSRNIIEEIIDNVLDLVKNSKEDLLRSSGSLIKFIRVIIGGSMVNRGQ